MADIHGSSGGPVLGNGLTDAGKLRIWALVRDTYALLGRNLRFLARIAAVPAVMAFVLNRVALLFLPAGMENMDRQMPPEQVMEMGGAFIAVMLVVSLILAVLTAAFAVSCHRLALMGAGAVPRLGIALGRREGRFMLVWIVIAFFTMLFAIIPMLALIGLIVMGQGGEAGGLDIVAFLVSIAAMLFVYGIFFRYSLALPATAVDAPGGLMDRIRESWRLTKGTALRLFCANVVAFLLLLIPMMVMLGVVLLLRFLPGALFLELAVNVIFSYVGAALFAVMLSLAYQRLAGLSPPP